jgi:hypothetical protein
MSFARVRKLFFLALAAGAAYWIYRTRPTMSGFIDDLTRPLFHTKAVVQESEHKRVVAEAAPAVGRDEAVSVEMLKEGMRVSDVRELIGAPDAVEYFREDNVEKMRWVYRRLGRVLVFQDKRVVSIVIR